MSPGEAYGRGTGRPPSASTTYRPRSSPQAANTTRDPSGDDRRAPEVHRVAVQSGFGSIGMEDVEVLPGEQVVRRSLEQQLGAVARPAQRDDVARTDPHECGGDFIGDERSLHGVPRRVGIDGPQATGVAEVGLVAGPIHVHDPAGDRGEDPETIGRRGIVDRDRRGPDRIDARERGHGDNRSRDRRHGAVQDEPATGPPDRRRRCRRRRGDRVRTAVEHLADLALVDHRGIPSSPSRSVFIPRETSDRTVPGEHPRTAAVWTSERSS